MIFHCLTMKTASVADLRNRFPSVYRWIEDGETVELTKRGRVIARIVPAPVAEPREFRMPDFKAIRREVLGANPKVYPSIVQEERDSYTS
jgi:antitoxin (DNA-binding transcriptional repressor) of toxin-antitoxin stability system